MHIQGEARGWTVSMVSIADRKTGTILHAAFPASLDPSLLTFASILCARWFVGNHCQEGLTWAFLHESLYLRERARNINPGLVHEPTRPPVPQRDWTRWNTKIWTRGELPIGLDTSSYRADSSGKGLKGFVGVLVTDDSRKFFFFSFRLVCAWFSLLDGRVFFFEDCLIWFVEIDCKIDWRQVKFMCYIYINPNLKDHKKDWRDLSITLKRFFFSFRQISNSITGRILFFEELMWFDIVCDSRL